MEPASIVIAAAGFAAAQVAQKCADAAIEAAWEKIKQIYLEKSGKDPQPADLVSLIRPGADQAGIVQGLEAEATKILSSSVPMQRAQQAEQALAGARVLWIDDQPENNLWERATLQLLGVDVMTAETTRSAVACLERQSFDVIISDIARGLKATAGVDDLPKLQKSAPEVPVLFYIGKVDHEKGCPDGARGITNDPGKLLELLLDSLGA